MTVWSRVSEIAHSITGTLGAYLGELSHTSSAPEKSVGFTIGMIALGAKMARADGIVVSAEIDAFKQVFQVPEKDAAAVDRIFDMAKQDVAGYESYAQQVAKLFSKKAEVLENVLDGLFHIAKADGLVLDKEMDYLRQVADIFGFNEADFLRISSRHVQFEENPFDVLGLPPNAPLKDIKARYKKLVRDLHPDKQIAAGVPAEMVKLATDRLARINQAYAKLARAH